MSLFVSIPGALAMSARSLNANAGSVDLVARFARAIHVAAPTFVVCRLFLRRGLLQVRRRSCATSRSRTEPRTPWASTGQSTLNLSTGLMVARLEIRTAPLETELRRLEAVGLHGRRSRAPSPACLGAGRAGARPDCHPPDLR